MELNADFLSRLINQIRQQGAIAVTLGSGTRLIASWKQDAAAVPTIEVKVVPPQQPLDDVASAGDPHPRMTCPSCNGSRIWHCCDRDKDQPISCPFCDGNGWIYQ